MFTARTDISEQMVEDLLCNAMESGGYGDFVIVGYEPAGIREECEYPHFEVPFKGGTILLRDKYGDSKEVYRLDRAGLQRGLDVMAEKYKSHMSDFVNERDDAITATVFLQCALLGEIVYG